MASQGHSRSIILRVSGKPTRYFMMLHNNIDPFRISVKALRIRKLQSLMELTVRIPWS